MKEREIKTNVQLCLPDGTLNPASIGWARKPIITSNLKGRSFRKKKWNYWCIYGRDALFSATISNLDYATVCFVYFLDYESKRFFEKTVIVPLDKKTAMPNDVQETVQFSNKQMHLSFISSEKETLLKISANDFDGGYLEADILITYPENIESLQVVVPWNNREFQFTAKHHCLPAQGYFRIGKSTYTFEPETDYAVLDYGRGIWPRKSSWNWGMASGNQGSDTIGLNFGGKWTDHTGSTENAVILNNELFKISEDVQFLYDREDFMKEWKITSQSSNVELSFTPFFERIAKSNVLIVQSEVHQMVGHYNGKIQLASGKKLIIDSLLGCIEDHYAKW